MLSPLDADLVRRDPALPGLGIVLDLEAFAAALQNSLPAIDIGAAHFTYVKYAPGVSCLVGYRLVVDGAEMDVYAKAYGDNAAEKLQKAQQQPGKPGALGKGRFVLEKCQVIVSPFPNDSQVRSLPLVVEPEARRHLLNRLFPSRPDFWEGAVQAIAYKPERRYVARLYTGDGAQAVLKLYTAADFLEVSKRQRKRYEARPPLKLAPRLGKSDRHAILAFEWLSGRMLNEALLDPGFEVQSMATVGAAIARLHAQPPGGLARQTHQNKAGTLHAEAYMLGYLNPGLARRAEALASRMAAQLVSRPPAYGLVHGDFHARQVLLDETGAAILDLDRAVCADPVIDLGVFIAHLEREVIRGDLPANRVEDLIPPLLAGYQAWYRQVTPDEIWLYSAVELLRLAPQFFRYREPDWPGRMEASLDRVEALLARTSWSRSASDHRPLHRIKTPDIPVSDPFGITADPCLPFLAHALNPTKVQPLLERFGPHLGEGGKLSLRAIRVLRHKPGRRCLIAYDLGLNGSQEITLIGKARSKGPDHTTCQTLRQLWSAGFGPDSPDGIRVPEPIGIIPELGMWFQRGVPGVSAGQLLAEPGGTYLAGRIADAAHKLHTAAVHPPRQHSLADELRILHERLQMVVELRPEWSGRIARLLAACDCLGGSIPEPRPRGIHRDFYPDQVLVDGEQLYLLDFDLYSEGDVGVDIGNFVGHLTEHALRTGGDPAALSDRERALVERFLELAGESARPSVQAYTTLTLVRHIYLSTKIPKRRHTTAALISLCERRLAEYL